MIKLKERIEKEFDERFPSPDGHDFIGMERISSIESFILSFVSQILSEKAEEIGRLKLKEKELPQNTTFYFNQALAEAIRIVKEI